MRINSLAVVEMLIILWEPETYHKRLLSVV